MLKKEINNLTKQPLKRWDEPSKEVKEYEDRLRDEMYGKEDPVTHTRRTPQSTVVKPDAEEKDKDCCIIL